MGISSYIKGLREKIGNELLLLPSVSAIIVDERGWVLLQRQVNDGKWYTIGGSMEPGEEPADAVVREALEETGLVVAAERITGVQSSPVVTYPNGHQCSYVAIVFRCRVVGGKLAISDDESLELEWFPPEKLPELRPDQLIRVQQSFLGSERAFFTPPGSAR